MVAERSLARQLLYRMGKGSCQSSVQRRADRMGEGRLGERALFAPLQEQPMLAQ
jgi:hypothetical protein